MVNIYRYVFGHLPGYKLAYFLHSLILIKPMGYYKFCNKCSALYAEDNIKKETLKLIFDIALKI